MDFSGEGDGPDFEALARQNSAKRVEQNLHGVKPVNRNPDVSSQIGQATARLRGQEGGGKENTPIDVSGVVGMDGGAKLHEVAEKKKQELQDRRKGF